MINTYVSLLISKIFSASAASVVSLDNYSVIHMRDNINSRLQVIIGVLKYCAALRLNTLVEYTAYDVPTNQNRFILNLMLLSIEYNYRLVLNYGCSAFLPTLSFIYLNSNWCERELRDMFGIFFFGNPDLRRLLTDYGFQGFPLRKDFPLTGYSEVRYDDELQHILYEPVQLSQEFRVFSLSSPWEKK